MIPADYIEWKDCIENRCGIKLTQEYIQQRVAALSDDTDIATIQFAKFYGNEYKQQVVGWFKQVLQKQESNDY